jgi:hypothetical protein
MRRLERHTLKNKTLLSSFMWLPPSRVAVASQMYLEAELATDSLGQIAIPIDTHDEDCTQEESDYQLALIHHERKNPRNLRESVEQVWK